MVGPLSGAFEIGLMPLERDDSWLRPIIALDAYLEHKNTLLEKDRKLVFGDIGGTSSTQLEIFDLIAKHLITHHPDSYRKSGHAVVATTSDREFTVSESDEPKLVSAGRLVGDDLILMRRSNNGWVLAAGFVCFPSVWKLPEKLGLPMASVHSPVPGFGTGTRKATLIDRIFDHLSVGRTVSRNNWSIHAVDDLHLPKQNVERLSNVEDIAKLFLRGEIQTLTKLSSGADILFTIGVDVNPIAALEKHPQYSEALVSELRKMNARQLRYKGLDQIHTRLIEHLTLLPHRFQN